MRNDIAPGNRGPLALRARSALVGARPVLYCRVTREDEDTPITADAFEDVTLLSLKTGFVSTNYE
jgi:hypothetical protein